MHEDGGSPASQVYAPGATPTPAIRPIRSCPSPALHHGGRPLLEPAVRKQSLAHLARGIVVDASSPDGELQVDEVARPANPQRAHPVQLLGDLDYRRLTQYRRNLGLAA